MNHKKSSIFIKCASVFAVLVALTGAVLVAMIGLGDAGGGQEPQNGAQTAVIPPDGVQEENPQKSDEDASQTADGAGETDGSQTADGTGEPGGGAAADVFGGSDDEPEVQLVEITISAVGDLMFGRHQRAKYDGSFDDYYDTYGVDYFLQNVRDIFAQDDCTIGNLEGTLTESDNIRSTKEWNHKGRPEYVGILTGGSVEVVSLGNNHIMDYNEDGVRDTFKTLEDAGVAYAISGTWGDRYELYETKKGIKIGFVSVNEYYEGNEVYTFLEEGLHALREQGADLVFALMHWGGDKTYVIEDEQYEIGRWCIDEGYDLVLGCHPHVLQGIECYKGKYIVYSMGNFCYGGNKNPPDKDTLIFRQTFTFADGVLQENPQAVRVIPCRLSGRTDKNDFCPVVLSGGEAEEMMGHLNGYCAEFGVEFDKDGYLSKLPNM